MGKAVKKQDYSKRTSSEDVMNYIKDSINNSDDRIFEASLIDMANFFGIQSGTMNYHVHKLEGEGKIKLIDQEGKYSRKRYVLPEDYELLIGLGSIEEYEKYIKSVGSEEIEELVSSGSLDVFETEEKKEPTNIIPLERTHSEENKYLELNLDERIKKFLEESKSYNKADVLLKQDDKDILAVLNETIQQNMSYLKDLTDQLSTVQTKDLFFSLIEEREKDKKAIQELKELNDKMSNKMPETSQSIDPKRVRHMQQIIVNSVDRYINLQNHAMALGRLDFREDIMKEVKDLVDYVLKIKE